MADVDPMEKHFRLAGIEDDPKAGEDKKAEVSTENDPKQEEQTVEEPRVETGNEQPKTEEAKPDPKPEAAATDKPSGGTDSDPKPGKEEKGKAASSPGDLTLQDGSVVKSGAERRWYEKARTAENTVAHFKTEAQNWRQKAEAATTKVQQFTEAAQRAGVEDPTQMTAAIRLYKDLASNPKGTVEKLLVELKAAGHTIDGIGGIDTAAINQILDQRLKPTVDANAEAETQRRIEEESANEVNSFFAANPDARIHEPFLAALITQNPNLELIEVYSSFKDQAIAGGFDWSKPLGPQIEAKKQQQAQVLAAPKPTPMVNGNNGAEALKSGLTEHDPAKIPAQADTMEDAIIAGMRDAGINYKR